MTSPQDDPNNPNRSPFTPEVHQSRQVNTNTGLGQDAQRGMRSKLIESIMQLVVQAITGVFLPGPLGSAFTQLSSWAQSLGQSVLGPLVNILVSVFDTIPIIGPPIGDAIEDLALIFGIVKNNTDTAQSTAAVANTKANNAIAGVQQVTDNIVAATDGGASGGGNPISAIQIALSNLPGANIVSELATHVIPDVTAAMSSGIQGAIDGIVNGLRGLTGGFWSQDAANAALAAQAAATAAAAAALAQLQGNNNQSNTGGVNEYVDFSTYPNSTNLPSNFTTTYIGGSTGAYGVASGLAQRTVDEAAFGNRTFVAEYNVKDTATDIQRIGAVWTGPPGSSYQNPTPFYLPIPFYNPYWADQSLFCRYKDVYNWVRVRFDSPASAGNNYPRATLECCVAGTLTQFVTVDHVFQPNTAYWIEAGTPGGDNIFRVICGTTPIITYIDAANVAQKGAAFRGAAIGGYILGGQGQGGPVSAGPLLGFSMQDNKLATYLGKQARWYRANTGGTGIPNPGMVPNGFFDTPDYNTGGIITMDAGGANNCRVTVAEKGIYEVVYRNTVNAANPVIGYCWINGVLAKRGGSGFYEQESVWLLNLNAGDYFTVGNAAPNGGSYFGDASGAVTYLEVRQVLGIQ